MSEPSEWSKWASEKARETKELSKQRLYTTANWTRDKLSDPETYNKASTYLSKGFDLSKDGVQRLRKLTEENPALSKYLLSSKEFSLKQIDKMNEMYRKNPDFYNGVAVTLLIAYGLPYLISGAALGAGLEYTFKSRGLNIFKIFEEFFFIKKSGKIRTQNKDTTMLLAAGENLTRRFFAKPVEDEIPPKFEKSETPELKQSYHNVEHFFKAHPLFFPSVTFTSDPKN